MLTTRTTPWVDLGRLFSRTSDTDLFWQLLPSLSLPSPTTPHTNTSALKPLKKGQYKIAKSTQKSITSFFQLRSDQRKIDVESHATWGDHLSPDKAGTFRAVFNNVNGISPRDKFAKAHIIGSSGDMLQADLIGMAETNVHWSYKDARSQCINVLRNYWSSSKVATSASGMGFGKIVQPGGTMSIVANGWAARSRVSSDTSSLGRWTSCTITGKH